MGAIGPNKKNKEKKPVKDFEYDNPTFGASGDFPTKFGYLIGTNNWEMIFVSDSIAAFKEVAQLAESALYSINYENNDVKYVLEPLYYALSHEAQNNPDLIEIDIFHENYEVIELDFGQWGENMLIEDQNGTQYELGLGMRIPLYT